MMGVGAKRALGLYRSCAPRHRGEECCGRSSSFISETNDRAAVLAAQSHHFPDKRGSLVPDAAGTTAPTAIRAYTAAA